jgi:probable phosphoglycerate mutase
VHLTLVRHGEPERNAIDLRDPGLSALGRAQAHAAGVRLRVEEYDAVYSSPQLRALQTARIITDGSGRPIEVDDGLVEFDYGAEYVHYDDASDPVWRRYFAGDLSPWGLTAADFHTRVSGSMAAIVEDHREDKVLAVCHGGVINAWTCQLLGAPERIRVFEPHYAALNRYRHESGRWHVESLNEMAPPPSTSK